MFNMCSKITYNKSSLLKCQILVATLLHTRCFQNWLMRNLKTSDAFIELKYDIQVLLLPLYGNFTLYENLNPNLDALTFLATSTYYLRMSYDSSFKLIEYTTSSRT